VQQPRHVWDELSLIPQVLFLLLLLSPPAAKGVFSFSSQVGVAVAKSGRVCLTIHRQNIVAGSKVALVLLRTPQSVSEAEVVRPADGTCPKIDEGDMSLHSYEIRMLKGSIEPSMPAIAIFGASKPFVRRGDSVTGDVDGDGTPEFFRSCASSEGVHLTVWSGKPVEGKRRWHQYYYLGYDVQADCTTKDVGDQ
jgi:hypothetical protein